VCDASLHFIYAGIGGPGATPDVTAFQAPTINKMVENLPGPYYVVGDAVYIPTDQMMTPYTSLTWEEYWKDAYNFYLSQMQICIKMAFGRLTTKWRILRSPLQTHLPKTILIVDVVCCLHNYVINWQKGELASAEDDYSNKDDIVVEEHKNAQGMFGYYELGDDPEGKELAIAAVYDNDNSNNVLSSIAGMIQQNQWQQPDRNLIRNK
jgi:DDE superfamily endonuclease